MKKEIPILFSTTMVQAILEGRKTMTRRIVKWSKEGEWQCFNENPNDDDIVLPVENCPYGKPGDILWVRESWAPSAPMTEIFSGRTASMGIMYKAGRLGTTYPHQTAEGKIDITRPLTRITDGFDNHPKDGKWKPSIHMPKDACRIWLEITEVSVERLQEITEDDAEAEGVLQYEDGTYKNYFTQEGLRESDGVECLLAMGSFQSLWASINGLDSWCANPWVWVVSFKVLSTSGKPF